MTDYLEGHKGIGWAVIDWIHRALNNKGKGKGKAIPLQASTDPERFRRLRLPHFKTVDT